MDHEQQGVEEVATISQLLPYSGHMSPATEEHVALVALLRTLAKGERWESVTERLLESLSAVAIWQRR